MQEDGLFRMTAAAGFFAITAFAWVTGDRRRVDRRTVVGSMVLIWAIGFLTFWLPWSRQILGWVNDILVAVLNASQKGTIFLFGPLIKVVQDHTPIRSIHIFGQ